ncbi:MAG: hypothetical protein NWF07_13785 [Candidatus Bathyarchaeota archaeon]|nr:hypothetical protein [Candidatus Bathyarchaeota archaeon]
MNTNKFDHLQVPDFSEVIIRSIKKDPEVMKRIGSIKGKKPMNVGEVHFKTTMPGLLMVQDKWEGDHWSYKDGVNQRFIAEVLVNESSMWVNLLPRTYSEKHQRWFTQLRVTDLVRGTKVDLSNKLAAMLLAVWQLKMKIFVPADPRDEDRAIFKWNRVGEDIEAVIDGKKRKLKKGATVPAKQVEAYEKAGVLVVTETHLSHVSCYDCQERYVIPSGDTNEKVEVKKDDKELNKAKARLKKASERRAQIVKMFKETMGKDGETLLLDERLKEVGARANTRSMLWRKLEHGDMKELREFCMHDKVKEVAAKSTKLNAIIETLLSVVNVVNSANEVLYSLTTGVANDKSTRGSRSTTRLTDEGDQEPNVLCLAHGDFVDKEAIIQFNKMLAEDTWSQINPDGYSAIRKAREILAPNYAKVLRNKVVKQEITEEGEVKRTYDEITYEGQFYRSYDAGQWRKAMLSHICVDCPYFCKYQVYEGDKKNFYDRPRAEQMAVYKPVFTGGVRSDWQLIETQSEFEKASKNLKFMVRAYGLEVVYFKRTKAERFEQELADVDSWIKNKKKPEDDPETFSALRDKLLNKPDWLNASKKYDKAWDEKVEEFVGAITQEEEA